MALSPFFGGRSSSIWDPFSSAFWDPSNSISIWRAAPDQPEFMFAKDVQALMNTRVDWKESEDAHSITADLPGLSKEDVKVELEDRNILKISGERRKEEVKEGDIWHRVERATSKFMRIFRLPDNVETNNITATFNNGVLQLVIPKAKETKMEPRSIEISHSSGGEAGRPGGQAERGAPQGA
ncbi:hypothetical protein L7F22_044872 [Adiantum nelumboides]|nr:hypothetical protein [Adiantum nelumboides]